jgi:hypothetical protein
MNFQSTVEKLMVAVIFIGLILSVIITVQHLTGQAHRSYDPWLLPVFAAMSLQIVGMKKR